MKDTKNYVTASGITHDKRAIVEPPEKEVQFCEIWLMKFGKKPKVFFSGYDAKNLRHRVNEHFNIDIKPGALIRAALNLGFRVTPKGDTALIEVFIDKYYFGR